MSMAGPAGRRATPAGATWSAVAGGRLPIRRILVIQTQRLGDVVCLTPLLTALRRQFPDARLAALVHRPHEVLLESNPDLDQVLTYDRRTSQRSLLGRLLLIRTLRRGHFDWALSIHAASSVAFALCAAGIPWRTCVWRYGRRRRPHWAAGFHQQILQDRLEGDRHETEHNLDVLRRLGMDPDHDGYRVCVTDTERQEAAAWLRERGRDTDRPLAFLHPGHGGGRQSWPAEQYAAVGEGLVARGFQVAISGGPAERDLGRQVAGAMGVPSLCLAGEMGLRRLLAVLEGARLFVSVPTGPMHLASALRVPVVALYGPSDLDIDRTRFCPYQSPFQAVVSPVACACPASRNCPDPVCMAGITPAAVLAAAGRLVE